jgi:hypothetical protein
MDGRFSRDPLANNKPQPTGIRRAGIVLKSDNLGRGSVLIHILAGEVDAFYLASKSHRGD